MKSSRFCPNAPVGVRSAASPNPAANKKTYPREGFITSSFGRGGRVQRRPLASNTRAALLRRSQVRVTIALVAILVRVRAHRAVLAVADGAHPVGGHAQLDQEVARRGRPAIAQTQVVF